MNNPHIIGLTGSFGSGCSYIGQHILRGKFRYDFLSLSEHVLKPLFKEETGKEPDQAERHELQRFGDEIRSANGAGHLAEQIIDRISEENNKGENQSGWIVDSIRNPAEIRALRRFSRNFFLFGVYADKETRWERVKAKYGENRHDFDEDDQNDTGEDNEDFGQRVGDCFYEADIVLTNDVPITVRGNADFEALTGEVGQYVDLVQKPLSKQQPIRRDESLMAAAYVLSQRSSCRKRKVGAVIADAEGNIISSGYNEVPAYERPCTKIYNDCHRDWLVDRFFSEVAFQIKNAKQESPSLKRLFRKQFKILDYCRALHAEENAIVNLARNGRSVPLEKCVLYTTTYPCRMCANKIVNVGIKEVVYLEPYPDEQAKSILKNSDVNDRFFKGVTFKAYSRLYGEEK
jgi:deoxycytidylate deaminase/dephospho-CoA kinase